MQIIIDIPNEEVPNKQEIIDISLHFIAGEVCECSYPYIVLPKGHGDLVDRNELIENGINKGFCDWYDEIKNADAIIEADGGDAE